MKDTKRLANTIGAPYSEPAILQVLEIFGECFKEAVVVWRTTDRPGDTLNYRTYLRRQLDTISIAVGAGLLESNNQLVRLITSWSSLYDGKTEQWCDFDPNAGLVKTWVNLRGRRAVVGVPQLIKSCSILEFSILIRPSITPERQLLIEHYQDDILYAPEVPAAIRTYGPTFHSLGLELVTFVAVDYYGGTMNLYFVAPGPLSRPQAAEYVNLAGSPPPTDQEFRDMLQFLNPGGYHFAVTIDYQTGRITRVAFYALDLPLLQAPNMDDRIIKFFAEAPSYDQHQTRIVAWSYGLDGSRYMKAESSYIGELATLGTLRRDVDT